MSRQKNKTKKSFTPGLMSARTGNNKRTLSFAETMARIQERAEQIREEYTSKVISDIDDYVTKVNDVYLRSIHWEGKVYEISSNNSAPEYAPVLSVPEYGSFVSVPGHKPIVSAPGYGSFVSPPGQRPVLSAAHEYGKPVYVYPDLSVGFEKRFLDTIQITGCNIQPAKSVFHSGESITVINDRLRVLWIQFRESRSTVALLEIKTLVSKLHSLFSKHFRSAQKNLKGLIKSILISLRINKKRGYRLVRTAMYKCYNDFSGSEEEKAVAYNLVGNNFFKYQLHDRDTHRNFKYIRFSFNIAR